MRKGWAITHHHMVCEYRHMMMWLNFNIEREKWMIIYTQREMHTESRGGIMMEGWLGFFWLVGGGVGGAESSATLSQLIAHSKWSTRALCFSSHILMPNQLVLLLQSRVGFKANPCPNPNNLTRPGSNRSGSS